ncbi:hypothetical protein INT46_004881 [Mucor plumbeus]|uniref:Uncharacterized protein n=1 Tax=Mucor plumbeus TaxID=97098 RepID=A0A8H7QL27_9FUNG|nr:hypothetical protein INT46_004881 [Mucor plumbeus]
MSRYVGAVSWLPRPTKDVITFCVGSPLKLPIHLLLPPSSWSLF